MGYPDENGDVVQALEWLKGRGASKLYLVGDSSGATQVVQTLLQLGDMRAHGQPTVPVEAGVGFSAWLDMVGSSPTYDSLQTCDNNCQGIGTQIYLSSPSGSRKQRDCCWASRLYSSKSASNNRAGRALRDVLGAALRQVAADQPPDYLAVPGHAGAAARPAATHARARPGTPSFPLAADSSLWGSRRILRLWLIF